MKLIHVELYPNSILCFICSSEIFRWMFRLMFFGTFFDIQNTPETRTFENHSGKVLVQFTWRRSAAFKHSPLFLEGGRVKESRECLQFMGFAYAY